MYSVISCKYKIEISCACQFIFLHRSGVQVTYILDIKVPTLNKILNSIYILTLSKYTSQPLKVEEKEEKIICFMPSAICLHNSEFRKRRQLWKVYHNKKNIEVVMNYAQKTSYGDTLKPEYSSTRIWYFTRREFSETK